MFYSDARQDEFIARLFNFKKDGTFVDIGSCNAVGSNNTFFLEGLGWNGLCVELNANYNNSYAVRKCKYINQNALELNYSNIFEELEFPSYIDYLSMDIDELSFEALIKLPHEKYRFRSITIEHDAYRLGDVFRKKQRDFLNNLGYYLVVANIYVEQDGYPINAPFEDWWVDPKEFNFELINKTKSDSIYPSALIKKMI